MNGRIVPFRSKLNRILRRFSRIRVIRLKNDTENGSVSRDWTLYSTWTRLQDFQAFEGFQKCLPMLKVSTVLQDLLKRTCKEGVRPKVVSKRILYQNKGKSRKQSLRFQTISKVFKVCKLFWWCLITSRVSRSSVVRFYVTSVTSYAIKRFDYAAVESPFLFLPIAYSGCLLLCSRPCSGTICDDM